MADTEGKVHKGGQNREYQITERPPDPPPMRPLAPGSIVVVPRDAVVVGVTPERAGREGDQPLPERGAESVFAEMHRRLDAREAIGIKRYGRSLETFNGRDAARDLEEELLDALAYATQARLERQEVDRRLAHALEQLKRVDALRVAAEADLASHVAAQDRRIEALKAELAAARANWDSERRDHEATAAAFAQAQAELGEVRG